MSFEAFFAAIDDPALRDVAQHWRDACGRKRMPAWRDIDPAAIARHLPIVWSWKYDRARDSFTGRLAGERIIDAFGRSLRGVPMSDFFRDRNYEMIFARHKRIVIEPAFSHGTGPVFIRAQRFSLGERIMMPLAEDGIHGDGVFGATVYPAAKRDASDRRHAVDPDRETVTFWPLD